VNNTALTLAERAAYHEAGHLVMARELGIRVDALRMPAAGATMHASIRFAERTPRLSKRQHREKQLAIQRYIRFLLAGPVAVILRLEEHHGIGEASVNRSRFRKTWLERAIGRSDADLDAVYSLLLGWGRASPTRDLDEEFQPYWQLALASYEYPTLWHRVRRAAQYLLANAHSTTEPRG
jgi:hypothetical protein